MFFFPCRVISSGEKYDLFDGCVAFTTLFLNMTAALCTMLVSSLYEIPSSNVSISFSYSQDLFNSVSILTKR